MILHDHYFTIDLRGGCAFKASSELAETEQSFQVKRGNIAAVAAPVVTGQQFTDIFSQPGPAAADVQSDSIKQEMVRYYWKYISEWFDTGTLPGKGVPQ